MSEDDQEIKHFINADGKKIACRYWFSRDEPRALVFISHGAGEHCGCYHNVAESLTAIGLKVFAHDHIGHGLSEGDRMHISSFSEYVRDVFQHVEQVQNEHKGLPCFILGHSMGGTIALQACMQRPQMFKGMALIGPAVVPNPETATKFKITVARVLSRVLPHCPVAALNPKFISKDQSIVEKYEKDPLVYHGKLKAKWAMEFYWAVKYILAHPEEVTTPLFVIQGSEDKLVEKSGATFLEDKAASTDKTVKMIEGSYHQVHNEPDGVGLQCVEDICSWISQRI